MVAGVDFIAPKCGAGIFQGHASAFGLFALAALTLGVQIRSGLFSIELGDVQFPTDAGQHQGKHRAADQGRIGFELIEHHTPSNGRYFIRRDSSGTVLRTCSRLISNALLP